MKRHNHHIVSKRGQKYELDQQKWTMSSNFPWNHSIVEAGMNIFVEPVDQSKSWDYINHIGQHAEDTGCFKLFPRQDPTIKPFIFLDGHSSRLKLPFLKYNNDPKDHWVACIGVPYGTAL